MRKRNRAPLPRGLVRTVRLLEGAFFEFLLARDMHHHIDDMLRTSLDLSAACDAVGSVVQADTVGSICCL